LRADKAKKVAEFVAEQLQLGIPHEIKDGCGSYGCAFKIGNKALKVTSDPSEVVSALKTKFAKPRTLAEIDNVWKVISKSENEFYYVILMEFIENKPRELFDRYADIFHAIADASDRVIVKNNADGESVRRVLDIFNSEKYLMRKNFNYDDYVKDLEFLLTAAPELDIVPEDRKATYDFAVGLANIKRDLMAMGLNRNNDFTNFANLGYGNDGILTHFDVGGVARVDPPDIPDSNTLEMDEAKERPVRRLDFVFNEILKIPVNDIKELRRNNIYGNNKARIDSYMKKNPQDAEFFYGMLDEDGSAKFSTDTSVGRDDFPTYNQNSTEPSIENNLDANSALYDDPDLSEDLEYNHVSDATDDEYMLTEEQIGTFHLDGVRDGDFEVFKNPTSIKRLKDYVRGIIGSNGDLYIINDNYNVVHNLFADWLKTRGYPIPDNTYYNLDVAVPVQRYGKTNRFYISESIKREEIETNVTTISEMIYKAKEKNPTIDFVLESINYAEPDDQILIEDRKKAWVPGSKAVTVKKKCRLGGLGNTSVACNQGDINNLEFSSLKEDIDPSEAYDDVGAIQTVIDGKRNVCLLTLADPRIKPIFDKSGLESIGPIDQGHYGLSNQMHIVYRPEGERAAKELYLIMLKNNGYVPVRTAAETRRIGELLDYRKESIDIFIERHFGAEVPSQNLNEEKEMLKEKDIMTLQELPFKLELERMGGKIYAVGGSVRDSYIGKSSKDLDLVITGVPAENLEQVLSKYGNWKHVGKAFGVYKFVPKGSTDEIDIALPRTEKSTGPGHKDFEIVADHRISLEQDLERRDFTMNAIAKDVNGTTIDPYNGLHDISNGIIRAVGSKSFSDDPLRMLRGVQFASRFGFRIEPETYEMLQQNADKINTIAPKRIEEEFEKIVKKGDALTGAKLLKESGLLKALVGHDGELFMGPAWNDVSSIAEFIYLLTFNMVKSPLAFAKDRITNEAKILNELEAIETAMSQENRSDDPVQNRKLANEMYKKSPTSINSKILPRNLQRAAEEFNTNRFPKTIKEMEIDGNILQQIGFKQGAQLGEVLEEILNEIYAENVRNNKEELLNLAQSKAGEYLELYKD